MIGKKSRDLRGFFVSQTTFTSALADSYLKHRITLSDCIHNTLPGSDFAEHGVTTIEVRLRSMTDKELTAISVGSGIGH